MPISGGAARKKYLKYLLDQYKKGVLAQDKIEMLRREGLLADIVPDKTDKVSVNEVKSEEKWSFMMDPYKDSWKYEGYKQNITKNDWKPTDVLKHTPEFVKWINSMLYGSFMDKVEYEPFNLYKVQAYRWLQDEDNIASYHTDDAKREYKQREYDRNHENSLYYVDKYGELKEGDISSGLVKYKAREHHAIVSYLFDCGYNLIGGKGRQIGWTSIMGLLADKKLVFQANYYIKFITEDKETGEEIFADKIKYPFGALPKWMQPKVKSDSGTRFWLSDKMKKGEKGYPNSRIDVIAPKITAINGGSPQLVLIDEIGTIPILGAMLNEGRPTMFWNNPITGKFELRRQVIAWGTGGNTQLSKGEYEKEWYRILGLWENKQYEHGFVPIFFSWHCRFDRYEYEKEKAWYYGARAAKEGIDLETSKTQFHQHYPSSFRDMFLKTASNLVSREIIEGGLDRCRNLGPRMQPVYGYFEPVFNEMDPMPPEHDVPYRIVGSRFAVIDDEDDIQKASACMFRKPEDGWENRYWQGTDPIATETGHSKFASGIWDEYEKTVSCIVNFRRQHDHKYVFLQSLLMGLHYDTNPTGIRMGVKELVEANIGTNYIDYKEAKGFFASLVFNSQLPSKVAGGSRLIGIDNKGIRNDAIIDFMTELIRNYHERFYIPTIFEQLSTFCQDLTKSGKETWAPMNRLMHFDDVLFAVTYAYICRLSHMNLYPVKKTASTVKMQTRYVLQRQKDYSLIRVPTKVPSYEQVPLENLPVLENEN